MTTIYENGVGTATVPDSQKVAIYSNSPVKLYKKTGYPNYPDSWTLVTTTTGGTEYVSAAFTGATDIRMEASAAIAYYEVGAAPSIFEPLADQSAADATFTLTGLAAAQGGSVEMKGGTSSTAGNAGGEAKLTGGQPGATGVGGAATVAAGAGGATSGNGGVASITGGAGTNGNGVGGVGKVVGGAGNGSGAGGAAQVTGGAAGATGTGGAVTIASAAGGATSGNGGDVNITSGAGTAGNGNGGCVKLTAGAKNGTGKDGCVAVKSFSSFVQPTPTAKTTAVTLTIAELMTCIITGTHAAGATQAYTLPTGANCDLTLQFANDDSFDWSLLNLSAAAVDTITLTASAGHTIVGNPIVQSSHSTTGGIYGNSAIFRTRKTAADTYVTYRVG